MHAYKSIFIVKAGKQTDQHLPEAEHRTTTWNRILNFMGKHIIFHVSYRTFKEMLSLKKQKTNKQTHTQTSKQILKWYYDEMRIFPI